MHFKLEHIYESCLLCLLCYMNIVPGVVACICNPATLEAEFRNLWIQYQLGVIVLR